MSTQELSVSFRWPNLDVIIQGIMTRNIQNIMRTLNPRNSINALCKKPEENKIQAHCQQRIENQGWMQNPKTAKQGACCIQKKLKHRNDSRVIV